MSVGQDDKVDGAYSLHTKRRDDRMVTMPLVTPVHQ